MSHLLWKTVTKKTGVFQLQPDALSVPIKSWADFSDSSTLFQDSAWSVPVASDGDPIGGVTDKSGNGNHWFQGTSAFKPTFRTNFLNGLSVGQGDGGDSLQNLPYTLRRPITIFVVSRRTEHNTTDDYIFDTQSTGTTRYAYYYNWHWSAVETYAFNAVSEHNYTKNWSDDFEILTIDHYQAPYAYKYNSYFGRDVGVVDGQPNAHQPNHGLRLFSNKNLGNNLTGEIAEFLVYDGNLSQLEREGIWGYLEVKWGF